MGARDARNRWGLHRFRAFYPTISCFTKKNAHATWTISFRLIRKPTKTGPDGSLKYNRRRQYPLGPDRAQGTSVQPTSYGLIWSPASTIIIYKIVYTWGTTACDFLIFADLRGH